LLQTPRLEMWFARRYDPALPGEAIVDFARFAAIDWSGAKGKRHKNIAVALAEAGPSTARKAGAQDKLSAPVLVRPGHAWSRTEVLDWLLAAAAEAPTLFGFDCSFAPPLHERGEYLPGEPDVPADAKSFWAYVDALSEDEDLGAASFLEKAHRRHFYFGAADGTKRDFLHHRACEHAFNATGGGKASTLYDAIGAAQVAKASFAGMRLLHRLAGRVPVWPMDPLPEQGSVVVELYTRAFIRLAGQSGRKVRTLAQLDQALAVFGSRPAGFEHVPNDHETDVLIAAAGMRAIAAAPRWWNPPGLTPELARTEGWTFGVR
jgi:hypothetical protein